MQDIFGLQGRVALITGASSGIGAHMAKTLAKAGADTILVARRQDRLDSVADEITTAGGAAETLALDLFDKGAVEGIAALLPKGKVADIIVNAAGVNPRQPPDTVGWEAWDQAIHLNLDVPFFLTRALVPGMKAKGGGNVINIASLQSFRAFANGAPYGASKGGIVQLTRAMAEAWSKDGIATNAIAPGFFPTELTAAVFADEAMARHHADSTAVGRNGALEDLESATVFLAAKRSRYITGQTLSVDGGYTAT